MKTSDATMVPTELEWHRAAAWWAGEGSVSSKNRKLGVTVAQKERSVCDWLQQRFGGAVYYKAPKDGRNEIHYWQVCGDRARAFLRGIFPLIPESPRRMEQVSSALLATAGRLKTGPKPSLVCMRGHSKEAPGGRCVECERVWRAKSRSKPEIRERRRQKQHDRYHNDPLVQAKKLARHALVQAQEKLNASQVHN